jgi:hypothetical protein
VDEQHRPARPHDLMLELDAVDLGVFHECSSALSGPAGRSAERRYMCRRDATCRVALVEWAGHRP